MKIVFTAASRGDLRTIARHISRDNPKKARLIVDDLRNKADEIRRFPEAFQSLSHSESGIRRRVVGRYLILYRIRGDRVVINRIVHGAQDFSRLAGMT